VRGKYSVQKAKHKAYGKMLHAKRNLKKIRCHDELEKYIRKKVKEKWSPELIS
jgi:IS30 family transposase